MLPDAPITGPGHPASSPSLAGLPHPLKSHLTFPRSAPPLWRAVPVLCPSQLSSLKDKFSRLHSFQPTPTQPPALAPPLPAPSLLKAARGHPTHTVGSARISPGLSAQGLLLEASSPSTSRFPTTQTQPLHTCPFTAELLAALSQQPCKRTCPPPPPPHYDGLRYHLSTCCSLGISQNP